MTFFLSLMLGLMVGGICFASCDSLFDYPSKAGRKMLGGFLVTLFFALGFSIPQTVAYSLNVNLLSKLCMDNDVNIPNHIMLIQNLNTKVNVHSDQKNLIVDIANQGQSVRNTDEWKNLLSSVEYFNRNLREFPYATEHPFLAWLNDGFYPSDTKGLKYIKLNELAFK